MVAIIVAAAFYCSSGTVCRLFVSTANRRMLAVNASIELGQFYSGTRAEPPGRQRGAPPAKGYQLAGYFQ